MSLSQKAAPAVAAQAGSYARPAPAGLPVRLAGLAVFLLRVAAIAVLLAPLVILAGFLLR